MFMKIELCGTMAKAHHLLFLILTVATLTSCYCPINKVHRMSNRAGECAYSIHCIGNIRNVSLPNQCKESSNYAVAIDLVLTDAVERLDTHIDQDFLSLITTLRISAHWPQTKLSILQYTTRLQNLYLVNDKMEKIDGFPFNHLNQLETIDLSHNRLTDIEELFTFETQPNKLKKLSLAYNAINEIPGDAFGELTSLIELDLSHNHILDLNEEPFFNLTSLEILRLNNNEIKNLNGAVNNLQNLKHLYLRGNQIQNIDVESLKIIIHLETFDVSWNNLEEIKPIMFSRHWKHMGGHSVCKIILSENHITSVPNATSREISARYARHVVKTSVDVLTELDLSKNMISNIEYNAFQSLVKLISLDLSQNKLINFMVNAKDVEHIQYLNLSSNWITRLYFESFSTMNNLQNLDLSHNKLDNIPDQTFTNNYNLKHVNMTFNEIEKLDNLNINVFHRDGGVLDLSNNGLSQLRITIGEGMHLVYLIIHSNNITDPSFIDLTYQSDLKHLDMSRNLITELYDYSLHLPLSLVVLDLGFNQIQKIGPSSFLRIPHLRTLRLANNQLTSIEYGAFHGLTDLLNLDLSFNRIHYLNSKLLMDLKSLTVLSIRYNNMNLLEYDNWYGHKRDLKVYIEGNNFTCEWLGGALRNYNNGFSKMRPVVLTKAISGQSLEGIPCKPEGSELQNLIDLSSKSEVTDERLLVISQKILETLREQTYYLRNHILRSIREGSAKSRA